MMFCLFVIGSALNIVVAFALLIAGRTTHGYLSLIIALIFLVLIKLELISNEKS